MKPKMTGRCLAAALCLMLCVLCLPLNASAITAIPKSTLDAECSLTLSYRNSGVEFQLYRVANVTSGVAFTPVGRFANYNIGSLNGLTSSDWRVLAQTLDIRTASDPNAVPLRTGVTNANGMLTFEGLTSGLYLVKCEQNDIRGDTIYTPTPFLVCLPNWSETEGRWVNNVGATIKYGTSTITETTWRRALKVWNDDNDRAGKRPDQIRVVLLRNNVVYDTRTLSADNNWYYDWTNLDSRYQWRVEELLEDGSYTSRISLESLTFRIENTPVSPPPNRPHSPPSGGGGGGSNNPPNNPPPDPGIDLDDPDVPLSNPPVFDEEPPDEEIDLDDPDVPLTDFPDLPQTGQLWWPVPMLALGGMFLMVFGWAWNRRSEQDEE